jgi:hypothetical protein
VDSLRPLGTVRKASDRKTPLFGEKEYPANAVDYTLDPFGWVSEYKKTHFGPVHTFPAYNGTNGDYGVYDMGDFENLTIVLGSDFGAGTEETDALSQFIQAENPHYTIHMGDVYYVGSVEEIDANMMGKPPKGVKKGVTWPKGKGISFSLIYFFFFFSKEPNVCSIIPPYIHHSNSLSIPSFSLHSSLSLSPSLSFRVSRCLCR